MIYRSSCVVVVFVISHVVSWPVGLRIKICVGVVCPRGVPVWCIVEVVVMKSVCVGGCRSVCG